MEKNNQKKIINCIVMVLIILAAAYCVWYLVQNKDMLISEADNDVAIEVVSEETTDEEITEKPVEEFLDVEIGIGDRKQKVALYCDSNSLYAFLPSYAKEKELSFLYNENEYQVSLQGEKQIAGEGIDIEFGQEYPFELTCLSADGQVETFSYMLKFVCSDNIPAVFIETKSGGMEYLNADKENQESGMLVCIGSDGKIEYDGELEKISGRGNSSWEENKKSYGITLATEEGLAGMEKASNWILQANALDASRMRNKITYDIAREIGLDYAVDSEYVDVYFNGEYAGNYLMCEKIEVGENRVDIEDLEEINKENQSEKPGDYPYIATESGAYYALEQEPQDVTGGYLLEFNDRLMDNENRDESFIQIQDKTIEIKNPKHLSEAEYEYISGFIAEVNESLQSATDSNDYQNYIDVSSWSLVFLLNELSNDTDANRYSAFYYKDKESVNSKLCAGPVWDYDIAWGNDYPGYDYTCSFFRMGWYNKLYDNEEFYRMVVENYKTKMQPVLERYTETEIDELSEIISASIYMDEIRWQNNQGYGKRSPYQNYTDAVNYLKCYMQNRNDFYTQVWLSGENYHRVFFQNGDTIEAVTYVKHGETVEAKLTDYMTEVLLIDGWRYNNGNSYNSSLPILNDTVLYAKPIVNTVEVVDSTAEEVDNNNWEWHRWIPIAVLITVAVSLWNLYILFSLVRMRRIIKKEKTGRK